MEKTAQSGERFGELVAIMKQLLSPAPGGCPWDREQTLQTLRPFLLEESYEVIEALDDGDVPEHCSELGDLLFQIVFQAELRAREGAFGIDDVVGAIAGKMIHRHPHVFGDAKVKDADEVLANWSKLKATERAAQGKPRKTLEGIPRALPALLRAQKVGERAAQARFDWPDLAGVRAKIDEELAELDEAVAGGDPARIGEELGDLLFVLTRLASKTKVDAEAALHACMRRFETRFYALEERAEASGRPLAELSLDEMDAIWRAVKRDGEAGLPKK